MYELKETYVYLYLILYGGVFMLALLSTLYLLFSKVNIVLPGNQPPRELRFWTAIFLAVDALSHIWWIPLGNLFTTEYSFERNAMGMLLDGITIYPTMMIVLLRMLQDKRRPAWPLWLTILPVFAIVIVGAFIMKDPAYADWVRYYMFFIDGIYALFFILALRKYGRWLHDNYADLERKELWQSLLLMAFLLSMLFIYKTIDTYAAEYMIQVGSLLLIAFLVWRVETLQQLTEETNESAEEAEIADLYLDATDQDSDNEREANSQKGVGEKQILKNLDYIGDLLATHCEATKLYLQYDLTLSKLSAAIGTNRTYLSAYFAQLGITYNTYINRLRIAQFVDIYREAAANSKPFTIQVAAQDSGFQNYRTFSQTFKNFMGLTASEWIKQEQEGSEGQAELS